MEYASFCIDEKYNHKLHNFVLNVSILPAVPAALNTLNAAL